MKNHEEIWHLVLKDLETLFNEEIFNKVFAHITNITRFHNGLATIAVEHEYEKNHINRLYSDKINELASKHSATPIRFKFVTKAELINSELEMSANQKTKPSINFNGNLDHSRTFSNFIVGDSNRFAFRSAMAIAEQPGVAYNPLYIFGGVGLGKTHLMHAVGNLILDNDVSKKILYVPATTFMDDFLSMLKRKENDSLQEKYGSVDVLLIDDIQLMNGPNTQNQFFKLFNHLHGLNKQIIITSDRPASELKDIMTRLTSRFEWGLAVDLNVPDLEHRKRILKSKLHTFNTNNDISDEVLEFLAANFSTNIRELESALNRLLAYSVMNDANIDIEFAKEALDPWLKTKIRSNQLNENNYDRLMSVVADFYSIAVDDLIGKRRNAKYTQPRHIAMYLMKQLYQLPYKTIGQLFGNRDHSTVLTACEKIEHEIQLDEPLKNVCEILTKKISTPY